MIRLTDVNCRLGRGPADREGSVQGKDALLALMDDFSVEKAVAYGALAQYGDPLQGNDLLTRETEGSDRFLRQWAVLPALWDLYPAPEEWVNRMKQARVCSVRLFPKHYGHSLRRYAAGELMDALARRNLPAFIDFGQLSSWDALFDLCRDYPQNRFVVCATGYRCLRWLVPLLDHCPNLYAETSTLLTHDGLSELCRHGYGDRLLFGSGFPEGSLASAASQLLLSDLSEAEKQKIGALNAHRLLSEVVL